MGRYSGRTIWSGAIIKSTGTMPQTTPNATLLGPSILTADFLNLGAQLAEAESAGIDFVHLDVMDGRFVPNITFGLPVIEAVRRATSLPLDVHLMIVEPERYVADVIAAGADIVTVQVESSGHLHRTLQQIREAGATGSVTMNPGTPLGTIEEVLPFVGQVLVMSVNPGFGGQQFIPSMLDKIRRLRTMLDDRNPSCRLEVDGGIKAGNVGRVIEAGVDTVVAGSAIFNSERPVAECVAELRAAMAGASA